MKLESVILNDFFNILNKLEANYCVMNNYTNMPEIIPSDVDFAVDQETFGLLDSLIIKLANKHNVVITQKIWHGYNKCAFILSPIYTDRYFWLQLDFFVDFSGKGFPNLLPSKKMLDAKKKYKNFFVPKAQIEVPFILQRRIFKGDIKQSHVENLIELYSEHITGVSLSIISMFGDSVGQSLCEFIKSKDINMFTMNYDIYRAKLKKISSKNTNLEYRSKYIFNQIKRALYRLFYPTGLCIAFLGKELERQELFINDCDKMISGSFHGTTYVVPASKIRYLITMIKVVYWSKVIKRKVYINLDSSKNTWFHFLNKKTIKLLRLEPDVIIDKTQKLFDSKDNERLIEVTSMILMEQAKRTKRHLLSQISPTGKTIEVEIQW